ncbi:MAG TPA: substrate-binding domain-containing protein [Candidatus Eremiobacteraceae bacterium]|nr:substrate-binding domain-containing protein [Candidatus Eremiobacteraceae bacterium]
MKRFGYWFGLCASVSLLAAGCSSGGGNGQNSSANASGSPAAGGAKTIGVSIQDLQAQFYEDMELGMKNEASKYGYAITFVDANRDQAKQTSQVEDFISKGVSAIVLTPADSKAVGSAILEANQAGIPVFTADIASSSDKGVVVSHIASDNVAGGKVAAQIMCKALNGPGSVVIIDQPEVTSVQDRVKGFKQGLATCKGATIAADQSAGGDQTKAASVMDNLLQTYPNVRGVFGINDNSALGALSAVQSAGKTGKVVIVGYDASPIAQKAIDAGQMAGDPQQHPDQIGKLTIDAIHDYFNGKTPVKLIPVAVGSYTTHGKP